MVLKVQLQIHCIKAYKSRKKIYVTSITWCFAIKLLKVVSTIFLFFHQMIALQKLWKMLFSQSKKLFSFSRYSNFCILILCSFSLCHHCLRVWSEINLQVYDVINCLNKNLISHFVWYLEKEKRYDIEALSIDTVLNKEHFNGKIMQKMCTKS